MIFDQLYCVFVHKHMQCLQQVEVPVRIGITADDCGRPRQVWLEPKRGGYSLVLRFMKLSDQPPDLVKLSKTIVVFPLQADFLQQLGHWLQA